MDILVDLFLETAAQLLCPSNSRHWAAVRWIGCGLGATAVLTSVIAFFLAQFGAGPAIVTPLYALAVMALLGFFLAGIFCFLTRSR